MGLRAQMWVLNRLEAIILKYKIGAVPTPIGTKLSFKLPVGLHTVIYILLPSVCPSVCDAVHCGSQGRCRGLKVVPT